MRGRAVFPEGRQEAGTLKTHHDPQSLLDTIGEEEVKDGGLDLHLLQADLQGHEDERHGQGGCGIDGQNLLVTLLGSGQAAEGWVVEEFHPHLMGRESQVRAGAMAPSPSPSPRLCCPQDPP